MIYCRRSKGGSIILNSSSKVWCTGYGPLRALFVCAARFATPLRYLPS
jgi:hypothetical protein